MCVFCLYIWCAAINPGDTGVFKSRKYLKSKGYRKGSREEGLIIEDHGPETVNKILDDDIKMGAMGENSSQRIEKVKYFLLVLFGCFPLSFISG